MKPSNSNDLKKSVYQTCQNAKVRKHGKNEDAPIEELFLYSIKWDAHKVGANSK